MGEKAEIQKQKNGLNDNSIIEIEQIIDSTEKNILALRENLNKIRIENEVQSNPLQKVKNFLRLLDVSSGLNFAKLLFWIGMADIIIFLSSDICTKIISAITYFLGIIFDMLVLRKQQIKNGAIVLRFVEGCLCLFFISILIALIIGLAACSLDKELPGWFGKCINWVMPICGILSTSLELINSICEDD